MKVIDVLLEEKLKPSSGSPEFLPRKLSKSQSEYSPSISYLVDKANERSSLQALLKTR
jgi:hypothetical protein